MPTRPLSSEALALRSAPIVTDLAARARTDVVQPPAFAVERRSGVRPKAVTPTADPQLMTSALALFARLFAPFLMAEMRATTEAEAGEAWVDQSRSPLGRRLHCALARSGALPARKMGRRWLVRSVDIDAYIVAHGRSPEPPRAGEQTSSESDEAAIRELLAACGETVVAPSSPVRSGKTRR